MPDPLTAARLEAVERIERPIRPLGPQNRWRRALGELLNSVAGSEPREVIDERLDLAALRRVDASAFDVVVVSHLGLARVAEGRSGGRWVLDHQFLRSLQARQARDVVDSRFEKWLWSRDAVLAARLESWASDSYDVVTVTSQEDADGLDGPAVVIPNGVDLEKFRPMPLPDAHRIVITASWNYLPNVVGVQWFCHAVLPHIRATVPDVAVDLVGRAPVAEVRRLVGSGVSLHPDVPSVVPFLEQARVAVVPVRIGAGTRLKALEALAAGRPLAGPAVGLGGLGIIDGVHALVRDDAEELARGIASLLLDDALANRLATAGRALVEAHFGWAAIGESFVGAVLG
jgi:glycosyltransferase involved in cell wall biosynthesis